MAERPPAAGHKPTNPNHAGDGRERARPTVVIIGAGLGGCIVADALADHAEVVIVETPGPVDAIARRIRDVGHRARLDPMVGSGPGGSTQLWHNGLIEIAPDVFDERWPFCKQVLDPWYEQAYRLLGNVDPALVRSAAERIRRLYGSAGIDAQESQALYFPQFRANAWKLLRLEDRVRLVRATALRFHPSAGGHRIQAVVCEKDGGDLPIEGDCFVCCAGGLGSPALLQSIPAAAPESNGPGQAGRHYEDHPSAFVGIATLRAPLYRFWNWRTKGATGRLRLPIVRRRDGLRVSFQLRPASLLREAEHAHARSILSELRNRPWRLSNYVRLLGNMDDVLDILSFRFGVQIPTRHYAVLMLAEQADDPRLAVQCEPVEGHAVPGITRDWRFEPEYLSSLRRSIEAFLEELSPVMLRWQPFEDWPGELDSAAHHSGTARMASHAGPGVCDADGRVVGFDNLYVCDGSLIPASGTANTGLTIAALAIRLGSLLRERLSEVAR